MVDAAPALAVVSRGKPARASSLAPGSGPAGAATEGQPDGTAAFATLPEHEPFWEIDLGIVHRISTITVWNLEDAGRAGAMRMRPLRVLLSRDGTRWATVATVDYPFGGARSGRPLRLEPAFPLMARFVRLQLVARRRLELDHVEIAADLSPPPHPYVGLRDLVREGDRHAATLVARHDAGFFSNCSTILQGIVDLWELGIAVREIDARGSFRFYRGEGAETDPFATCFRLDASVALPDCLEVLPDVRKAFRASYANYTEYRGLSFDRLAPFLRRYFAPAREAAEVESALMRRHGVDLSRTIGLCYRGTDKSREIEPAPVADYLAQAERLLARDGRLRLLVQTDQLQVRDALLQHFGERAFCFPELPVTAGSKAVHHVLRDPAMLAERLLLARRLVAAVRILAGCRYLVTHSGNVGLWLALLRGRAEGLWQFDAKKALVPPPDAE